MLRRVMPEMVASMPEGEGQGLRFEDVTLTYRTRRGTHQALGPLTLNCEEAASAMSESSILERAFYPVVIGLQSIPKVALAPLLIVWFGFGLESKVVMVALMCFFPCFVNTITGLKSYDRNLANMYRAFGSKKLDIFVSVKLPAALGHIFAGLQVSVILALLGTVVSEIISSKRGLGNVIQASALNFDVGTMFACVIILSAMGIIASQTIKYLHRKLVFWEKQNIEEAI